MIEHRCVPQQSPGVLDSLFPADFRPALVTCEVQDQIPRQSGQIPQPGVRPAEIRDGPRFPGGGKEDWTGLTVPNCLTDQFPELLADGDATGLSGLAGRLVFPDDDCVCRLVDVGNARPAEFAGARSALTEGRIDQAELG